MVVTDKSYKGYMDRANFILDHIETQYQNVPFWKMLWTRIDEELEEIRKRPDGERGMEFTKTNSRYPYHQTIPGLLAEVIAAVNIYQTLGWDIVFATDSKNQVDNTIDFWTGPSQPNQSVQVKAVRIVKNVLDRQQDLIGIKSDWVSLVDIDNHDHFLIANTLLQMILDTGEVITYDMLNTVRTRYFNNVYLYGTTEDRLVHARINK